jgi:hypothetical protein
MARSEKIVVEIVEKLGEIADEAYTHGHYIQSAIISFQLVELFLRHVINIYVKRNASSEDIIKKLEEEQRFLNLVIFLGLVKPNNGISNKLFDFNAKRNKIVHQLFYEFESLSSLENDLKDFCKESLELVGNLRSLIPSKVSELT